MCGSGRYRGCIVHRVDASVCNVRIGQQVRPDTIIGRDPQTGSVQCAEKDGTVTRMWFDGAAHVLMVVVSFYHD
jgi:hypothetical protein